jgi:beta-glucosidase
MTQQTLPATASALPYRNPALPAEARIADLLSRMTLQEKAAEMINHAAAIPRLGLPAYDWWNEGLHGVARAGRATVLPQAIGMAATWDPDLVREAGALISTEARVKNAEALAEGDHGIYRGLTFWAPNINIFRDPRWGRGQETYGEDPYLTSRLGVAFVEGMQGDDPQYLKVVATPKHFAVHSGPESSRHTFDARISPHDLEDTYLPAFRATVTEGHAASVMCSYNAVLGEPACGSDLLLKKTLRGDWRFPGYVVSDCGAIGDFVTGHKVAVDKAAAAAAAVRAGTDLDCGTEYLELPAAVARGLITEKEIDTSLGRLMMARLRLGMFDPSARLPWSGLAASENDSPEHRRIALRMARESLVLLKNEGGALPLAKSVRKIAVIGPNADQVDVLEGNYNGTPSSPVTVLDGLKARFHGSQIVFAQGAPLVKEDALMVPETVLYGPGEPRAAGLKAEYFDNAKFAGTPLVTRTEAAVNLERRQMAPVDTDDKKLGRQNYSVRWTGVLVPGFTGTIELGTRRGECWDCKTNDTARLYVDGRVLTIDAGTDRDGAVTTRQIAVRKGHPVRLRLDYVNTSGEGEIQLAWRPSPDLLREEAVHAALDADAVVMVLGLSPQLEGEEMKVALDGFQGGDRTRIDLPRTQRALFDAVQATGRPVCVVLMNGSALAINDIDAHARAVIEAWYPGEEGGRAVAEAIAGDFSPAGRLPVTFYRGIDQLPAFDDYSMAHRTYRYFDGSPLYRFGYGLSYTSFAYSGLRVDSQKDGSVRVSFTLKNTGAMAADEVAQVYVTPPQAKGAPLRSLAGLRRVHLDAGQQEVVRFDLESRALSVVEEEGERRLLEGRYGIWVGGGQPGEGTAGVAGGFAVAHGTALAQ